MISSHYKTHTTRNKNIDLLVQKYVFEHFNKIVSQNDSVIKLTHIYGDII